MHKKISKFLSSIEFNNFLDVGTGMGVLVRKLLEGRSEVRLEAIEISARMASALKNANISVTRADAKKLPFKANSFDVVNCSHLIEHFGYEDVRKVLDELVRVTVPQGYIIIITPLMWKHFYEDLDHVRPYTPTAIANYFRSDLQAQAVSDYNIEIVRVWYRYPRVALVDYYYRGTSRFIKFINRLLGFSFRKIGLPRSFSPNGYAMIMKKL